MGAVDEEQRPPVPRREPEVRELHGVRRLDQYGWLRDLKDPAVLAHLQAEPYGEMGLVTQKDHGLWQDQTGGPTDPQPGNIPGGARDVLRTADFNDGAAQGFFIDSGQWSVSSGQLQVAPAAFGQDAVAVFYTEAFLPSYFELKATINAAKPTGGYNANAYLVFDYQAPDDFKFAGLNVSTNKMVMGHRDASGWHIDRQAAFPGSVKHSTNYNLLLALNGTVATLVVNNKNVFTHVFAPRMDEDGFTYGLNAGMVGLGADNAVARLDNVSVQVLPPDWTLEIDEDFGSDDGVLDPLAGDWSLVSAGGGRYIGSPAGDPALSTYELGSGADSYVELSADLRTGEIAGLAFDVYGPKDFKFVALSAAADQVLIGHVKGGSWKVDASATRTIDANKDYALGLQLKGTTVSVTLDGQAITGYAFNGLVVDGDVGLLAEDGEASFDAFGVKTNDADLVPLEIESLIAAGGVGGGGAPTLSQDELNAVARAAIAQWTGMLGGDDRLGALSGLSFAVAELGGAVLGRAEGRLVLIDADAAGHGWFIDATAHDSAEFARRLDRNFVAATPGSEAFGRMDLLTAVTHELGHALGLDHDDAGRFAVMHDELDTGLRYAPVEKAQSAGNPAPAAEARSASVQFPQFDLDVPAPGGSTGGSGIDWDAPIAKYPFWMVAYHTLCYVDCYLSPDNAAFERLLAQSDPADLPARAHAYRCAGDPARRRPSTSKRRTKVRSYAWASRSAVATRRS